MQAQLKSFGLHLGYGNSKLKLGENNGTRLEESKAASSYYAGIFYRKTPSRSQRSNKNFLIPGIAFELGLCRSGGNFRLERKVGKKRFYENFSYLTYRMELALLGELRYSSFKVLFGPNLYYPLYNTRKRESEDEKHYNLKEYEDGTLALILGLGYEYSIFSLDIRYQKTITDYGQRYRNSTFEFAERHWRITFGINIFQKNRERNYDSIFWD